jgi:hypothetical protein
MSDHVRPGRSESAGEAKRGSLLFERLAKPSALSPTQFGLAVVLTAGAVLLLIHGLWRWGATGQFPDGQLLMAPLWALFAWETVESEQDWSAGRRRLLLRVEVALACVFAVVFAYGLQAWLWAYGDPWVPWTSFLYMLLPFGAMRRRPRVPGDHAPSDTPGQPTDDVGAPDSKPE